MFKDRTTKQLAWDYKWVIAAVMFLVVFTGLGFCSSAKSLYTAAITNALKISRSAFSINDSCRYVTTSVLNLCFGFIVYHFGTKKLIGAGMLSLILSSLIYSFATKLWMFYIGGVLLGIGVAWTTTSMVGSVVNKWFDKHRGTVMGAILASNGVGAAVAIHITSPIVYNPDDPFGYQTAYRLVSLILVVVTAIVLIFYREKPKSRSLEVKTETETKTKDKESSWQGFEYNHIVKRPYFYVLLSCIMLMMLTSVGGVVQAHFYDIGLDADFIASVFSVQVIILAVCKFLIGFIYDRFGLRITTNICFVTRVLSIFLLLFVNTFTVGKYLAVIYSIVSSIAGPLDTVMLPIFTLELFGERYFDKIVGIIAAVSTVGNALGAPALNIAYDMFGSYNISFVLSGIITVGITIAMNLAISSAKKDKEKDIKHIASHA